MQRRRISEAWIKTGEVLKALVNKEEGHELNDKFEAVLHQTEITNPWFTRQQTETALNGIIHLLEPERLENWIAEYPENNNEPKNIGVIMPGNIPMAGFHDMLCVILSENRLLAKLSGTDAQLLPFVAGIFFSFLPEMKDRFVITEQLKNPDAVIATGSNNTSRYFEYYFGKYPHIFRKNRNSAAVLNGSENEYDFLLLGRDIFTYYGLGCRNVSKLYVPENYSFNDFFQNLTSFSEVLYHNKYMNNFDYHQSLFLMNRQEFLTNNFLIIREEKSLATPVSVLHYEYYSSEKDLDEKLDLVKNELQCVVSKNGKINFGQSQMPLINDFADNIDTMKFLAALN